MSDWKQHVYYTWPFPILLTILDFNIILVGLVAVAVLLSQNKNNKKSGDLLCFVFTDSEMRW